MAILELSFDQGGFFSGEQAVVLQAWFRGPVTTEPEVVSGLGQEVGGNCD